MSFVKPILATSFSSTMMSISAVAFPICAVRVPEPLDTAVTSPVSETVAKLAGVPAFGWMLQDASFLLSVPSGYPTRSNSAVVPASIVRETSVNASLERIEDAETSTYVFAVYVLPSSVKVAVR